ncbi:hypothetical protein LXG23DRAFT_55008 [Yarrowia lipolytica]|nr:hypothetical protein LXG23DRAFT_55008 [Yarrowia lipolytica]
MAGCFDPLTLALDYSLRQRLLVIPSPRHPVTPSPDHQLDPIIPSQTPSTASSDSHRLTFDSVFDSDLTLI